MASGYKSIREFAHLANVSTDTVYRLIREGKIKQNDAGQISVAYLQEFQRKAVRDAISKKNVTSQLFIYIGAADEVIQALEDSKKELHPDMKRFDSLTALMSAYNEELLTCAEAESATIKVMYREHILREFVTRYKSAVKYEIDKLYDHEVAGNYPLRALYEFALYGKLYSDLPLKEEDIDEGVSSRLNTKLSKTFNDLVKSLSLYTSDDQPVFTRDVFTPELLEALEGMSFRECRSEVITNLTALDFLARKDTEAEKIWESIVSKYTSTIKSKVAYRFVKDGFYSIQSYKDTLTELDALTLSETILQGYYKEVYIMMTEAEFKQICYPLYLNIKTAARMLNLALKYANN